MNKSKIEKTIDNLGKAFNADERETSILFDHYDQTVHIETSYPSTARRLFDYFKDDPDVRFCERSDTLKITVPWSYCRKPDLILMAKYRKVREPAEMGV